MTALRLTKKLRSLLQICWNFLSVSMFSQLISSSLNPFHLTKCCMCGITLTTWLRSCTYMFTTRSARIASTALGLVDLISTCGRVACCGLDHQDLAGMVWSCWHERQVDLHPSRDVDFVRAVPYFWTTQRGHSYLQNNLLLLEWRNLSCYWSSLTSTMSPSWNSRGLRPWSAFFFIRPGALQVTLCNLNVGLPFLSEIESLRVLPFVYFL